MPYNSQPSGWQTPTHAPDRLRTPAKRANEVAGWPPASCCVTLQTVASREHSKYVPPRTQGFVQSALHMICEGFVALSRSWKYSTAKYGTEDAGAPGEALFLLCTMPIVLRGKFCGMYG